MEVNEIATEECKMVSALRQAGWLARMKTGRMYFLSNLAAKMVTSVVISYGLPDPLLFRFEIGQKVAAAIETLTHIHEKVRSYICQGSA